MPRVRVILATYNQLPHLRRSIRGYLRQTSDDFSLVVADDGSGEDTRAFLDSVRPELEERGIPFEHHWQEDDGFRKTIILNRCLRTARDESLFLFSDSDCVPCAHFVEAHLAAHEPWSFHVGGAVKLSQEATEGLTEADVDTGRYESFATAADRRDLARRARKSRWGTFFRRKNRPKCVGLNMAFDRALLESLNGFDERFIGYGYEDSDLRDRAMRHRPRPRVKVLYGRADVFHLWHPRIAGGRKPNRAYYEMERPVRCEQGLTALTRP